MKYVSGSFEATDWLTGLANFLSVEPQRLLKFDRSGGGAAADGWRVLWSDLTGDKYICVELCRKYVF